MYSIDKIYWFAKTVKGLESSFAGLARCGFIAIELLNSFVNEKIITKEDKCFFKQYTEYNLGNIN